MATGNQRDPVNIFWFRRDLRLNDNAGLYHALRSQLPVLPLFIFDKEILDLLEQKEDNRVSFIRDVIEGMAANLRELGSGFEVHYGKPLQVFEELCKKFNVANVFTNHDYEPSAIDRDEGVKKMLNSRGIALHTYKDQVIFEKSEIAKKDGSPYVVFTPYSRQWRERLDDFYVKSYPVEKHYHNFYLCPQSSVPTLGSMGFLPGSQQISSRKPDLSVIRKYDKTRDFPGMEGTSRMGIHLRFGTISIRELASIARKENAVYLNELIWRDFYFMILWHFPRVGRGHSFKKEYDNIKWRNSEIEFERWCEGKTGYPIVDAGMRQLNETGFMHNRLRMITASFLIKHLLIDWRWGEAYFAEKLLDYEFASNNGGWQWAAGSGCDAAPFFRVFNPTLQTKKFDPKRVYIRHWVPEFEELTYPEPIVEHEFARNRCLEAFRKALKS